MIKKDPNHKFVCSWWWYAESFMEDVKCGFPSCLANSLQAVNPVLSYDEANIRQTTALCFTPIILFSDFIF